MNKYISDMNNEEENKNNNQHIDHNQSINSNNNKCQTHPLQGDEEPIDPLPLVSEPRLLYNNLSSDYISCVSLNNKDMLVTPINKIDSSLLNVASVELTSFFKKLDSISDPVDQLVWQTEFMVALFRAKEFSTTRQLMQTMLDRDFSESFIKTMLRVSKSFREHDMIKDVFERGMAKLRTFGPVY